MASESRRRFVWASKCATTLSTLGRRSPTSEASWGEMPVRAHVLWGGWADVAVLLVLTTAAATAASASTAGLLVEVLRRFSLLSPDGWRVLMLKRTPFCLLPSGPTLELRLKPAFRSARRFSESHMRERFGASRLGNEA